jgi:CubicO group peptidase (beta-lactamase class C family)
MLVRHLMSHTSGLIYGFIQPQHAPLANNTRQQASERSLQDLSREGLVEQVCRQVSRSIAEPGAAWNYSAGSTDVLGARDRSRRRQAA